MDRWNILPDDGERRPNIIPLDAARARRHELAVADFVAALFDDELDNQTCQQLLADAIRRMDPDHVRRLSESVDVAEMWAQVDDILAGA